MRIKVRTFGSVTELLDREFYAEATDTDNLMAALYEKHGALQGRKLLVAVNNTVIQENTILKDNDAVAIMPPYSGG